MSKELQKWKRRALVFQDGHKRKSLKATALGIQLMKLKAASRALCSTLRAVHADPQYQRVWFDAQLANMGHQYSGPTYTDELTALEDAIGASTPSPEVADYNAAAQSIGCAAHGFKFRADCDACSTAEPQSPTGYNAGYVAGLKKAARTCDRIEGYAAEDCASAIRKLAPKDDQDSTKS